MSQPDLSTPRARNLALALLAMTQFVVVIDASIVNVALPSIGTALHFSQADLSWVVNSYTLTFGGFLLLGGRLADYLGRRRVFMIGMALFALASLAGGAALHDFFVATVISDADAAIAGAAPTLKRPVALGSEWISIGLDGAFVWRLPLLNEPPWDGHHYVLEVTRDPITRAVRKGVAASVGRIDASLQTLSRVDRNEILRRALRGA
jgi:hypothetical protein